MSRYYIVVRQLTLMALKKAGYTPTHDMDPVFNQYVLEVCQWLAMSGTMERFIRDPSILDYVKFEEICHFVLTRYHNKKKVDRQFDPPNGAASRN